MTQAEAMPQAAGTVIRPQPFRPPPRGAGRPRIEIPWLPLIMASVLALWAFAAWFVFTASAVTLRPVPTDARLEVSGWLAPRIAHHWLLRPGQHRVRASAPGYRRFDALVDIDDTPNQTRDIVLERLPGHVRIALRPAVKAEVLIDNQAIGHAPGVVHAVPAGTHQLEIRAPRYRPYIVAIDVEGKDIEQGLSAALEPAWAELSIDSEPPGAELSIDGQPLAIAPYHGELLEGRRVLKLTRRGYQPWQQTVKVVAGTPVKLGTVVLSEADGVLNLASVPPGASVTVDDNFVGRTPLPIALKPGRSHRLHVSAEGYVPAEREVKLAAAAVEPMELRLDAELANVQFITHPDSAELLIDGVARGSANQALTLPTREHEVTVRALGHATYTLRVTPRKGVDKRYRIRLKTIEEVAAEQGAPLTVDDLANNAAPRDASTGAAAEGDNHADTRATITTSSGQELKLFGGVQTVLGSSRADGARRADEVERPVRLERAFYLGTREVSNGEFRRFLANHHATRLAAGTLDDDAQPVVEVDWQSAALYCNWLSRRDGLPPFYQIKYGEVLGINPAATGYRLPTEAEWEWAARSAGDGARGVYGWGDRYPPTQVNANVADAAAQGVVKEVLRGVRDGYALSAPTGSFAPNAHGLYDLDGNVAEWVHDYYEAQPGAVPATDPLGPPSGTRHVIKGASWALSSATELRFAARNSAETARNDVGFRLARYAQ